LRSADAVAAALPLPHDVRPETKAERGSGLQGAVSLVGGSGALWITCCSKRVKGGYSKPEFSFTLAKKRQNT